MRPLVLLVYVGVSVLWGSTWAVIRVGLDDLPPLLFAGLRMALAAVLLAPVAWRLGALRGLPRDAIPRILLVGALQIAVPYGLLFVAQQWVPSALAAILFASFPIWIALMARVLLPGETLGLLKVASAAMGIAGIVVLELPHLKAFEASSQLAAGSALIVLASVLIALSNVLVRRHLTSVPPLANTTGQTAVGGILLLAGAALFEHSAEASFTPTALAALLYLAVFATGLTYVGLFWLVPRVPITAIGAIPLLDTSVAVLLGAVLLDEPVGGNMVVGGLLVVGAAVIAGVRRESGTRLSRVEG